MCRGGVFHMARYVFSLSLRARNQAIFPNDYETAKERELQDDKVAL